MSDYRNIAGERIKELRGKIKQDSICDSIEERTGKRPKRSTLSSWEKGNTCPDLEQLEALADIFSVDVSYLLGDIDTYRIENQEASKEYGLSENALDTLREMVKYDKKDRLELISKLIEDERVLSDPLRIRWWMEHPKEYFGGFGVGMNHGIIGQLLELCEMDFTTNIGVVDGIVVAEDDYETTACFDISDIFTGYFMSMCNDLKEFIAERRKEKGLKYYL